MTSRLGKIAALLLVAGCAHAVGTVPFSAEGSASSTATLAAGPVDFWTDLDLEYEGTASLTYSVELVQHGEVVATASCNPLARHEARLGWMESHRGEKHSRRGAGKMACAVTVPNGGPTEVRATLAFAERPAVVQLRQANLVLKQ